MRQNDLFELLAGAGEAAFVVDQAGRIRLWNRAAEGLFGVICREVLNKPCAAVVDGIDSAGVKLCTPDCPVLDIASRRTEVQPYDLHVRTANGERKWVNVSILVVRSGPNGERLLVHLMRDIDSRKNFENMTRQFAARVGRQSDDLLSLVRATKTKIELTARERCILRCLSLGQSTREIAGSLHVSAATVRNHVNHILHKLDTHNRLQAVMRATREGLI